MRNIVMNAGSQLIRNLHKEPIPVTNYTAGSTALTVSLSPNARGAHTAVRYTATQTVAVAMRLGGSRVDTKTLLGGKFTIQFKVRASKPILGSSLAVRLRDANTTIDLTPATFLPIDISTSWQTVSTVTALNGNSVQGSAFSTPAMVVTANVLAIDDWIEVTEMVVTNGVYTGEYVDGSTPGWKWDGTANLSTSVGLPYTLENVAGSPLGVNLVPGTGIALPTIPAFSGRTVYSVVNQLIADVDQSTIASIGAVSGTPGELMVRGSGGSTVNYDSGVRPLGGTAVFTQRPGKTVALHAVSSTVTNAFSAIRVMVDAGTSSNIAIVAPGTGLVTAPYLFLGAVNTSRAPVASYAFMGEHTDAVSQAVHRWLANKYGFTVA